ncbi:MAG: exonuclease subunit SbcC, partial [Microcystaceae cyanobacterium]
MIPLQLTLKNFLSYRDIVLDFRGLHTACICGANGAGKSSLLEAITWAIWGQSRAANDDDVIHTGADFVRVDFEFMFNEQIYRIIRSHPRGKSSDLEFQVKSKTRFRTLSAKGVRTTQSEILAVLKLDYDTFTNSAYLRQGRADEFMLRKPSERKQILADLLKLDQYETLASHAKDLSKEYKGQTEQLEIQLQRIRQQIEQKKSLETNYKEIETQLKTLQTQQDQDRETLKQLQGTENQRQLWQQQLTWQTNQLQQLEQEIKGIVQEKSACNQQLEQLKSLIDQEGEITQSYQRFKEAQQEEFALSEKFQQYQKLLQQKQQLEQQLNQAINKLRLQIQQVQTQLEELQKQEKELQNILESEEDAKSGMKRLRAARQRLHHIDQLQLQVSPLLQRKYSLETQIERKKAQQMARLEQLSMMVQQYQAELDKIPHLRDEFKRVYTQLEELENKKVYQERISEKGQDKKTQLQQIQASQTLFEQQIEELKQKIQLLEKPEATCPLCEQALNEDHRHQVVQKTTDQQQTFTEKIWTLQEEMAALEREIQQLRQEYAEIKEELKKEDPLSKRFHQIDTKLESMGEIRTNLKAVQTGVKKIEHQLESNDFAQDEQRELSQIEQRMKDLDYDEKTHGLVRGEVDKLRWAEIKMSKLEDAKRKLKRINHEKPQIIGKIAQLQVKIQEMQSQSEFIQEINKIDQTLQTLNYDSNYHQKISKFVQTQIIWQGKNLDLQKAKQQYPQLQEKINKLTEQYFLKEKSQQDLQTQQEQTQKQIANIQDNRQAIQKLEQKIQQQRQQLDQLIANRGKIEQSLQQIDTLQQESKDSDKELKELQKQIKIYQELAKAFGKNGIQALMIENILPQLEAESNHILARLTENQLHIQFVTQKSRRGRSRKQTAKLIDTLDILIADAKGTRTYETYSGGEAFRINFSIRLALAKLLAQRMGTALQMLVIDEGFGTQDGEGCERLIAAINAIAPDFACILTVTHMQQFKEAFQHRIEVYKSNQGSQLRFSS